MINFIKYSKLYLLISAIVLGIGLYSLVTFGYIYSVDFTGGTVIEYQVSKALSVSEVNKIRSTIKTKNAQVEVKNKTITIKQPEISNKEELTLRSNIAKVIKTSEPKVLRFDTVGPSVSKDIIRTTAIASLIASVGILLYMTFTFKKITHGLAAVLAMFHDFLVLIGVYSLVSRYMGAEFDTLFVTALLTTMSFSVHDTIVVFDKIREYGRVSVKPIETIANMSLTETMVRSINNSLTIIIMLIPLVLIGGETIRFFALALLIGTISGTYSSPFVATPLLVLFENIRKRKHK